MDEKGRCSAKRPTNVPSAILYSNTITICQSLSLTLLTNPSFVRFAPHPAHRSVLAPHADSVASSPRVISAIIQVFQGEGEDWPLEVYGHDGRARNVTMEEGDLVLYESHTVVHGRPFMR